VGSVNYRKRPNGKYQVAWRFDDGSQGAKTVDTLDDAKDLAARKRLDIIEGTWAGRRGGRRSFSQWDAEWWEVWSTDPALSPNSLAAAENRRRLHILPHLGARRIETITPKVLRAWQNQLSNQLGYSSVMDCRSIVHRILEFAEDEGAIPGNPMRKVRPPRRPVDPDKALGQTRRRALTPEEAGQLLACFPLFWWDHVICLLGTGLRFGEFAGLRRRRVHLDRTPPVLHVVDTRYQAGKFGSGFKPQPKSAASLRAIPLAPQVVEAIRRQLPPGSDPDALVFTGPGGGPGHPGGPSVPRGARTVLSRSNFRRTYHGALAKLADPSGQLRPTARRILRALRDGGPQRVDQLAARLTTNGRRPVRPATVAVALQELRAAGLASIDHGDQDGPGGCWSVLPAARHPLLDAVDLHGAHDFRHTFSTWLEDAGIPARVIDELMGHGRSRRGEQDGGSRIGLHYRHTTPEMAARAVAAIEERLAVVLQVAEVAHDGHPNQSALRVF
jgi:integrase